MNFKQIASYDSYVTANITMGLFTENEIKCQLKDEYVVTMDYFLSNAIGGIKLLVEENDYERAVALMKEAEDDYLKDIPCPNCSNLSLTVEEKINNPTEFWGKLKNQVLYGQTSTHSKGYRCTNCKKYFSELPPSY